jgi:hypothetical protein
MSVVLHWNQGTLGEWAGLLARIPRATLSQSWPYAEARMKTERVLAKLGCFESGGRIIGLVQVLERRAFGVLHRAQISRGPLWLPGTSTDEIAASLSTLRAAFPHRLGRKLTFMPELPAGEASTALLQQAGFRRAEGVRTYSTLWWDIGQDEARRRRQLRRDWRWGLNAAQRMDITIVEDPITHPFLPSLLQRYEIDMAMREFSGPDGKFLIRLRNASKQAVTLLRAQQDGQDISGILLYHHGDAATYQVGWSDHRGRAAKAMHRLLWEAAARLPAHGIRWIDMGGINPLSAPGVTYFKRGLGAEEVTLCGTWN